MNVRQCQQQWRRPVWEFDKDCNKYPTVPKHQATAFLFGAHNVKHRLAYHQASVLKVILKNFVFKMDFQIDAH